MKHRFELSTEDLAPTLAPPGAGLPAGEAWIARHVMMPLTSRLTSWDTALQRFEDEGREVLKLLQGLSPEALEKRVLIQRLRGLEDSSRHWSMALTVEHLITVGHQIAEVVVNLSHQRPLAGVVRIADVKPQGRLAPEDLLPRFEAFLTTFATRVHGEVGDRRSACTYEHPWFGPLTAHQWLCLAAFHQRIHRRQLAAIRHGL